MLTSSPEERPWLAGYHVFSSGLELASSILLSAPSNLSDVQAEITPPTSPTPPEAKIGTPKDVPYASRQLGRISLWQGENIMPAGSLRQVNHRALTQSIVANDEEGYGADTNGDSEKGGNGNRNRSAREAADTTSSRPLRRPTFLRVDTRQHRRVASMLATRLPPSSSFCDAEVPRRPYRDLPSLGLLQPTTASPGRKIDEMESYELRRRSRAGPVGLGIGFPENHPLRNRAFSMPIPPPASPVFDSELEEEKQRSEWGVPSASLSKSKQPTQVGVYSPGPARVSLRPTLLEVAPSPMEYLPPQACGVVTSRRDDVHDRSERECYCARTRGGRVD